MKSFWETKDGVIDNLLRAYVSRPGNPRQACPEFDPDLANAYIERSLTPGSRSRYEKHLSECQACRKNVVALMRLGEADPAASVSAVRAKDRATWLSGARQVFGALSRPQWAMAAAAAIVLAISVPVLLSRNETRPTEQVSRAISAGQSPADNAPSASRPAEAGPVARAKPSAADSSSSPAATLRQREKRENEKVAINSPAASRNAGVPVEVGGATAQSQNLEAKSASKAADEAQRKAQGQVASQVPVQAGPPESRLAKSDSDQGRRQQREKDSAQEGGEARAGRADEPRDKEKSAKAEEPVPPPAPASSSEVAKARGGLKRSPGKLSLRDSAGESVRPTERKINGKKFSLRDNTWTDKDFDPNKDLPMVTIIRDSNVYSEVLAKRAGLKPYLTAFIGNERAIIVYKGTVYKLIPQQGDK